MRVLAWKVSTFAALAACVALALHPVRGARAGAHEAAPHDAPASGGGFVTRWFTSEPAPPAASATARLLAQLAAARTSEATCRALDGLGYAGDGEATRAILDAFDATRRADVRECAVT